MNTINLFDDVFSHQVSSSDFLPTDFRYIKNQMDFDGITIYTDNFVKNNMVDNVRSKINIAWLCESKSIIPYDISFLEGVEKKYDYIFTHDKNLIIKNPKKYLFVIPASWRRHFPDEHVNFYENKEKLISFAYSNKRATKGHNYRHELGKILGGRVNQMGTGTNSPFPQLERVLAYKDYMFTLIVENDDYDYYFSEKIMEPYWAGTIPIYWGGSHDDEQIKKVFNLDLNGIITFSTTEELLQIIDKLSPELYISKIESVKKNYEVFTDSIYRIGSEEYFYKKYLYKFFYENNLNNLISCVL
jgi:hypothetical protein